MQNRGIEISLTQSGLRGGMLGSNATYIGIQLTTLVRSPVFDDQSSRSALYELRLAGRVRLQKP
jgi:hypothetical protein